MPERVTFDRLEGPSKTIAVLISDDGGEAHVPKGWLPAGSKPGQTMTWSLAIDAETTAAEAAKTKSLEDELTAGDDGGDLKL